jgi:superfamily II DNA/RNA helicase
MSLTLRDYRDPTSGGGADPTTQTPPVDVVPDEDLPVIESFDELGLRETLLRGIYGYGFIKPSAIQQKAILPLIQGKDTIA